MKEPYNCDFSCLFFFFTQIINDNDKQYIEISKLMKFLLRIIEILEKRHMNLNEIKSILRINIGDCFEFGKKKKIIIYFIK